MTTTLHGIIPPATTPFDPSGEIDLKAVSRQVAWYVESGCHGVAAGGSTGEGHTLEAEEFRDLLAATVDAAAGRLPVVAGIITDSTRDAVRRGRMVADLGVAALSSGLVDV